MLNNREAKTKYIRNLLRLPGIYLFLLKCVQKQKRFLKSGLEPELELFRRENDGSLTEGHFNKITSYYAMGVPSILGESLCVLRGFPMSRNERLCMSYLGGISGLLDDLFDEPGKSADHLEEFILIPEDPVPETSHEKVLQHMYVKGLSYSPHPDQIKNAALKVFKAQKGSLMQKNSAREHDITRITYLKGGNSFLFYRLCLFHELEENEGKMLFQLGGLMQLGNDIFDVWEDARDGIATLATTTNKVQWLREIFSRELKKTIDMVQNCNYEDKAIKKFKRLINLSISRVFVCLDQFEKLEALTGDKFIPRSYSRRQLICDMQKPGNQWKAIQYYLVFRQLS